MTPFEWLPLAYFAAFAVAGLVRPTRRHSRGAVVAALAALVVIVARFATPWALRVWIPHLYLVAGYWVPALFVHAPVDDRFERWLARVDERLRRLWRRLPTSNPQLSIVGKGSGLDVGSWEPGIAMGPLELAYLLCYPLVPAAFGVVFMRGSDRDIGRFWLGALIAGYACYGTLPWTAARPPRLVPLPAVASSRKSTLARINAYVLARVSHQHTTFPSGHVAVSLAAAMGALTVSVGAGLALLMVAVGVAVAAVAGRYHYLVDVLLGVVVGSLAWTLARHW